MAKIVLAMIASGRGRLLLCVLCSWLASGWLAAFARPAQAAPLPAPDDPAYSQVVGEAYLQWPLHLLEATNIWGDYPSTYYTAATRPADAPLIAIISTGLDVNHPDLRNTGGTGAAVSEGGQVEVALARTFLIGDPDDDTAVVTDEHGYGTYLAGIIAAATNNGTGIAGLAYEARLLPIKVAGADGSSWQEDVTQAITYAADQGAGVLLLALSGPTWSQALQDAVDYAWARGCLLIAPAGEYMGSLASFPAACPHVFAVGAATATGARASYSNFGSYLALAAPGGDFDLGVYSLLPTNYCTLRQDGGSPPYGSFSGTFPAAAYVAAAAALYLGAHNLSPATSAEATAVWQALEQAALPLTDHEAGSWDEYAGWGSLGLAGLVGESQVPEGAYGGIVGRVQMEGAPVPEAGITATPLEGGDPVATTSQWPTGAYRLTNLAPGRYRVNAASGLATDVVSEVVVRPGCDTPGVDFNLSDLAVGAALVDAEFPAAAVRGQTIEVAITLENTGETTWRSSDGYCLQQTDADSPFYGALSQANFPSETEVAPGASYTFTLTLPVPEVSAFCHLAWQLCQEGGHGRFGPIVEATISVTSFLDVPADFWAMVEIEAAKAAGIVRGYDGFVYRPTDQVARDQMAVYLARAIAEGDMYVPEFSGTPTFSDTPLDFWALKYVEYAVDQAVVGGYEDGTYQPATPVDRGQMAVFIARALVAPAGEAGLADYVPAAPRNFPDVPTDFWAYKHIEYCVERGVVNGYGDGTYLPANVVTRDQMAVYIARAFGLL